MQINHKILFEKSLVVLSIIVATKPGRKQPGAWNEDFYGENPKALNRNLWNRIGFKYFRISGTASRIHSFPYGRLFSINTVTAQHYWIRYILSVPYVCIIVLSPVPACANTVHHTRRTIIRYHLFLFAHTTHNTRNAVVDTLWELLIINHDPSALLTSARLSQVAWLLF